MDAAMTPPDTLRVKEDLLKHRSAINELKAAYDVTAVGGGMESPMETPLATAVGPRPGGVRFAPVPEDTPASTSPATAKNGQDIMQDVLLFSNPTVSFLVLLAGTFLIAAVHYLLSASPLTFLSTVSYLLLVDVAINFIRSLVSKRWQEQGYWQGSNTAHAMAERLAALVDAASHAHDHFLSARDPVLTLKVAGSLWVLAVLGSYISLWNVVTLAFVLAFTIPVGYQKYKPAISSACEQASSVAQANWDRLGMNRKQKAAVLALLLVMLWIRSAWSTRLVALLVGALAVRCHLKPAEVDYIMTHAEPYTQSVKKSARRLSIAATDFARRSLGTKVHFR